MGSRGLSTATPPVFMIPQDTTSQRTGADVVHALLAHPSRRAVVRLLAAEGGSGTVEGMIERLYGTSATDPDPNAALIGLYHQHLPKLHDAGVVEYDEFDGRLRLTPTGRRVETVRRETAALLRED